MLLVGVAQHIWGHFKSDIHALGAQLQPFKFPTGDLRNPDSARKFVAQSVEVMYDEPAFVTDLIGVFIRLATKDELALPPACGDVAHNSTERR